MVQYLSTFGMTDTAVHCDYVATRPSRRILHELLLMVVHFSLVQRSTNCSPRSHYFLSGTQPVKEKSAAREHVNAN